MQCHFQADACSGVCSRSLASTATLETKAHGQTRSNTYHLKHKYGWSGLLTDGTHEYASINLHHELITSGNVVELLHKHAVPYEPDYMSIDIDSADLWVLRAILASPFRPRVLTVEYNCIYGTLLVAGTHPEADMPWQGDNVRGCSLAAIDMVAQIFGWTLALVVPYLGALLIRDDLLQNAAKPSFASFEGPAGCAGHAPATAERAAILLDYLTWRLTRNEAAARVALSEQLSHYRVEFTQPLARVPAAVAL